MSKIIELKNVNKWFDKFQALKDVNLEDGYKNFSTIVFTFSSLEFLYLQRSGHRRCKFEWDKKGKIKSYWLVP